MKVWTFGNDPAFMIMPVQQCQLDALKLAAPDDCLEVVRGHYFAASALLLYGYWDTPGVQFLRSHRPVAQVSTYLIYDFTHLP
jgi:hypothetical protein